MKKHKEHTSEKDNEKELNESDKHSMCSLDHTAGNLIVQTRTDQDRNHNHEKTKELPERTNLM